MKQTKVGNIIKYAGAYVAYIIGSGFVTGQETIQFYTAHGLLSLGAIAISMLLFAGLGRTLTLWGYEHPEVPEDKIYQTFCGRVLGSLFSWLIPPFLFCVVVIMISGSGSILYEFYGIKHAVGSFGMALLIYLAYAFGLKGLIEVVGRIGPVVILVSILIGLATIGSQGLSFSGVAEVSERLQESRAVSNWLQSGILYVGYNLFGSVLFLTALGREAGTRQEAAWGGALGGIALMTTVLVMNLAFLVRIEDILGLDIPTLYLANQLSPAIGGVFCVILLAGIFSAGSLVNWLVCSRLPGEGSGKGRLLAAGVVLLALLCGQLPFDTLVGTVYPYTGYLGVLQILCVGYSVLVARGSS